MSQDDLSRLSGVTQRTISRLEQIEARPRHAATVRSLATALESDMLDAYAAAGLWPEWIDTEDVRMAERIAALPPRDRRIVMAVTDAMEAGQDSREGAPRTE